MAKMIADAKFKHDDRWLKSGDEFETDIGNAKDLVAMRWAHFKPSTLKDLASDTAKPAIRRGSYRRHDLIPGETPMQTHTTAEAEEEQ